MAPMEPLIALTVTFALLLLIGRKRWPWVTSLRIGLAVMFALTTWAHFGSLRDDLVRIVPPAIPNPELLVTLTGVAEGLGAIGLLIPRTAPWAAWGLTALLVAMFPANVYEAIHDISFGGHPATPLLPRTAMQIVFLAATIAAAVPDRVSALWGRRGGLSAGSATLGS